MASCCSFYVGSSAPVAVPAASSASTALLVGHPADISLAWRVVGQFLPCRVRCSTTVLADIPKKQAFGIIFAPPKLDEQDATEPNIRPNVYLADSLPSE